MRVQVRPFRAASACLLAHAPSFVFVHDAPRFSQRIIRVIITAITPAATPAAAAAAAALRDGPRHEGQQDEHLRREREEAGVGGARAAMGTNERGRTEKRRYRERK